MTKNPLLKGLAPMHPGELLREEVLPPRSAEDRNRQAARRVASDPVRHHRGEAADHPVHGAAHRQAGR
jgi:hypothetical protein